MKTQKGNVAVIVVLAVVIIVIVGVFGWMFVKKSQAPTLQPEVLTTLHPAKAIQPVKEEQQPPVTQPTSADETVSWQVYDNNDWGLQFKYPKSCKVEKESLIAGVRLGGSEECNFTVGYYGDINALSVNVALPRKNVFDLMKDPSLANAQKMSFAGSDAVVGTFENKVIAYTSQNMYVEHNGHIYEIGYVISSGGKNFQTNISQKILSTLKFTK
jgi:hypothetical protein